LIKSRLHHKNTFICISKLKHSSNQLINIFLSISPVTTLLIRVSLVVETALGGSELERPKEVISFFEVRANGDEFVDEVFNADDVVLSEGLGNDFVGGKGDSLLVDSSETSLVDQIRDSLSGGITESDVRFDLLEHVQGGSVNSDQSGVVDLSESEQL